MFEPAAQMTERILVWHKIDAELAAARVELADFGGGHCTPASPDGFVAAIGKRVFGVELQFVDLEIGEIIHQLKQRL